MSGGPVVQTEAIAALRQLRQARRWNRVRHVDWFEAFYQVYVTAFGCAVAVVLLNDILAPGAAAPDAVFDVRQRGAALVGLALAVAAAVTLRSGGRGGPLALEPADIRVVLLAPISRDVALRPPAWRLLRFRMFVGAVAGAIGGGMAIGRLDGSPMGWVACGALAGAVGALAGAGAAFLVAGRAIGLTVATATGAALLAWSVADALAGSTTSPLSLVGSIALWPLQGLSPAGVASVVGAGALAVLACGRLGGLSIEAAERRAQLVWQLQFAVAMRDTRTVVLLYRQLAQERARLVPWVRLRPVERSRFPVVRRSLLGLLRWPLARLARVAVLVVAAPAAVRLAVELNPLLLAVPAGMLWLAASDACEAMAQDSDHPTLQHGVPWDPSRLLMAQVVVPALALLVLGLASVPVILLTAGSGTAAAIGVASIAPTALLAVAGAARVLYRTPSGVELLGSPLLPELQSGMLVFEIIEPLLITAIGLAPLLALRLPDHQLEAGVAAALGSAAVMAAAMVVVSRRAQGRR